jgi:hypothetical protein
MSVRENPHIFHHAAIQLKPSKARLSLTQIQHENRNPETSDSEDDADEGLFELRNCLSDASDDENSSTINLLVPSSSTTTLRDRFPEYTVEASDEVKSHSVNDLGFTRDELLKRLQNLVNKSIKNLNGDDEVNNGNWFRVS